MPFRTLADDAVPVLSPLHTADRLIDYRGRTHSTAVLPPELGAIAARTPDWRHWAVQNMGVIFLDHRTPGLIIAVLHAGACDAAALVAASEQLIRYLQHADRPGERTVRLVFYFQGWDDLDVTDPTQLADLTSLLSRHRARAYAKPTVAIRNVGEDAFLSALMSRLEAHNWVLTPKLMQRLHHDGTARRINLVAPDNRLLFYGDDIARFLGPSWRANLNQPLDDAPVQADFARRMSHDYRDTLDSGATRIQAVQAGFGRGEGNLMYRYRRAVLPVFMPGSGMDRPGALSVLYKKPLQVLEDIAGEST